MEPKLTEDMIHTYIAEALENPGAAVAEAPAGPTQRDLRETVARLGAASPYMQPREELRARILQASAPTTFKMEDYRKAMQDNSRYYKWGFYAAMLFLMAAAWYNVNATTQNQQLQANLVRANQQTQAVVDEANDKLHRLAAAHQEMSIAVAAFAPNMKLVQFMDAQSKPWARAWLDESSKHAIMVLPPNMVVGNTGQIVVGNNENKVVYQAAVLSDPGMAGSAPKGLTNREPLAINLSPDSAHPNVYTAVMPH